MVTVCYQLDARREKKDGTYPIKLYIEYKGRTLISTDFCAAPRTWTSTKYNKEAKGYKAKNVTTRNLINRMEMLIVILDNNQKLKGMSDVALKDYTPKSIKNEPICKTFVTCLDESVGTKTKGNTIELYETTKNKILVYDLACTLEIITKKRLGPSNK